MCLVEEQYDVSESVERHEDSDLDGARRADAASSDGVAFTHQQQHHDEQEHTHHFEYATCRHAHHPHHTHTLLVNARINEICDFGRQLERHPIELIPPPSSLTPRNCYS